MGCMCRHSMQSEKVVVSKKKKKKKELKSSSLKCERIASAGKVEHQVHGADGI